MNKPRRNDYTNDEAGQRAYNVAMENYSDDSDMDYDRKREEKTQPMDMEDHQATISEQLITAVGTLLEENGITADIVRSVEHCPGGVHIDLESGETWSLMLTKCEE